MKKWLIALMFLLVCNGFCVDVANWSELSAAISGQETSINLTGSTYTMTANLSISYPLTITNTSGVNATLDGQGSYGTIISDEDAGGTFTFTGTPTANIIFTNTSGTVLYVASGESGILDVVLNYCKITYGGKGIEFAGLPATPVYVTAAGCEISNNTDGIYFGSAPAGSGWHFLEFTYGSIHDNTTEGLEVTGDRQGVKIVASSIYNNGGPGIYNTGSSGGPIIYLEGSNVYGNSTSSTDRGDIEITATGSDLFINDCNLHSLDGTIRNKNVYFSAPGGNLSVYYSRFYGATGSTGSDSGAVLLNNGSGTFFGNIFNGFSYSDSFAIRFNNDSDGVTILHNTVYNCYSAFYFGNCRYTCNHNIGSNFGGNPLYEEIAGGRYNKNDLNGYNCWHDYSGHLFYAATSIAQSTDITADPQFINTAIGNFDSLNPQIRALNIGAEPPAITFGGNALSNPKSGGKQ